MSMLPAAPYWAGTKRTTRAPGAMIAMGTLSIIAANAAFGAETAGDVLKKMASTYAAAKSSFEFALAVAVDRCRLYSKG